MSLQPKADVETVVATPSQISEARAIASGIIKRVEGRRMVMLAEVLAIMGAYHMAIVENAGEGDPVEAMLQMFAECSTRAEYYHSLKVIRRAH